MATARKKGPRKPKAGKSKPRHKAAPKKRDYKAEYARRVAREKALARAEGREFSRSVARGHPRRDKGELGKDELRQLRLAASTPSPGEARKLRSQQTPGEASRRAWAREVVGKMAGLGELPLASSTRGTRRGKIAETFARTFVALGLGTMNQAYTLYFSP